MINGAELLRAIDAIVEEKRINREQIFEAIKEGIIKSYHRYFEPDTNLEVNIDQTTGQIKIYKLLTVVEVVENQNLEIDLLAAKAIDDNLVIGDIYRKEINASDFNRLAALQVGQILKQHVREAEKESIYEEFIEKKDEILTGTVSNVEEQYYLISIDRASARLWKTNTLPQDNFNPGDKVRFYVEDISKNKDLGRIVASRTSNNFLKRLLEMEIPEIFEGTIEIKSVARVPGVRSKVAVYCHDSTIDAVGACVGNKGQRINNIMKELKDEKIDIIQWSEDPKQFLINALSPAKVISISLVEENHEANIIVPDELLSLAIGQKGIATKLVAKLTTWKINIIAYTDVQKNNIEILWNGNLNETQLLDLQKKHAKKYGNNSNER